jgi:uncharacterized protein (TIRG00374 family)
MKKVFKSTLSFLNKTYPFFFSLILIYFLIRELKGYNLIENFSEIQWWVIVLPIVFFGLIKLSNTFRYAYLYKIKERKKLFLILSFCNAFLSLLPFRLGEISYIKYLKDHFEIPRSTILKKLVLLRFFDLVTVYLLFLISSFYVGSNIKGGIVSYVSILIFVGLLIGIVIFSIIFLFNKNKLVKENKYYQKILIFFQETKRELGNASKKSIIILLTQSLFYWFLRIFLSFLILNFLGLNLSFFLVAFVSLLLLLIGLFPIKTFADFGVFEGGWAYFLVLIGFEYQEVLPVIINLHILLILPITIYGFGGWLLLKLYSKSKFK